MWPFPKIFSRYTWCMKLFLQNIIFLSVFNIIMSAQQDRPSNIHMQVKYSGHQIPPQQRHVYNLTSRHPTQDQFTSGGGLVKQLRRRKVRKKNKSGRLFSKPLGFIFGNEPCRTKRDGRNMTGICYNEVECLLKGGILSGYCEGGPPVLKGVCCIFEISATICDNARVKERSVYFKNPSYPRNDLDPFQCLLRIQPLKRMCWLRIDYLDFELHAEGTGGGCAYDSMSLLDSPDGPGGRICGQKSGYATLSRINPENQKDLRLSVIAQGPSYKWLIKISQIGCDQIATFPTNTDCGISNENGDRPFERISGNNQNSVIVARDSNSGLTFQKGANAIDSRKTPKGKNTSRLRTYSYPVIGYKNSRQHDGGLHPEIGTRRILRKTKQIQGAAESDRKYYPISSPITDDLLVQKRYEILPSLDKKNSSNCKVHGQDIIRQSPSYHQSSKTFRNIELEQFLNRSSIEHPNYDHIDRDAKRNVEEEDDDPWSNISLIVKKRLQREAFNPSFSARNVFCKSRFRAEEANEKRDFDDPASEEDITESTRNILLKIVDGSETEINEYPWMVSFQQDETHFCGGSLVASEWVLTAAHCFDFGNAKNILQRLRVSFSDHNVTTTEETDSFTRGVTQVIFPATWAMSPGVSGDIALVKLDKPVAYTGRVSPVCLPWGQAENTFAGVTGVTVGWGITEDGDVSDILREVELNIISNNTCYDNYAPFEIGIKGDMICVFKGPLGTETVCNGDSGGPLMVLADGDNTGPRKYIQVGITSFAMSDCSVPFPAVFARTTFYLEWLRAAITMID